MAQILVRNLDDDIKDRLRRRARKHKTSMEAEVRAILADALQPQNGIPDALGTAISARFSTIGLDTPLPELRGQTSKPSDFK